MKVTVRLFALLREKANADSIEIDVPQGAKVSDAIAEIAKWPGLADPIAQMSVVMAVNREYADEDSVLQAGDELALIPPVSGGARLARITDQPLSVEQVTRVVGRPGAGAVVTFQGTTRDVNQLDYESYTQMALEKIESIVAQATERHGLEAATAEHRIGPVPLGEPSVIVAASAAHRGEAFAGAREIIDRIKAEAPIWKKEVQGGDSSWVEGTPAAKKPL